MSKKVQISIKAHRYLYLWPKIQNANLSLILTAVFLQAASAQNITAKKPGAYQTDRGKLAAAENTAYKLIDQKKYAEAEPYLKTILEIEKQNAGNGNPSPAFTMARLAQIYTLQNKYREAEPIFKDALVEAKLHRSPARTEVSMIYRMYAQMLQKMNRQPEAEEATKKSNEELKAVSGH